MTVVPPYLDPADVGDLVPIAQMLVNMTYFGHVIDLDTPAGTYASMEQVGDEAVVTMDVIRGPKGDRGENAPIIKVLWDPDVVEIGDLPSDWGTGNNHVNHGYWIGDLVYIWTGNQWIPKQPGPAGPTGLTPAFSVSAELISLADQVLGVESSAEITGPATNRHIHFKIAAPQGPVGPAGRIRESDDYAEPNGINEGDVPSWNNTTGKYEPRGLEVVLPRFYSVPEGAFTNFSGVAQRQNICAFAMPPMPFPWVPFIVGHIKAVGLEIDSSPLTIGSEVRIGDYATGQLVARGFGNATGWSTFTPHFSTPSTASIGASPDSEIGVVPANHTGNEGTIYVNLYNDGLFGIYNFNKAGAQLGVLCIPVG